MLGRLRAHRYLQAEQSVESADRAAEVGNLHRRMVKPELRGSDRAVRHCLPAYGFRPWPTSQGPGKCREVRFQRMGCRRW
jgi:hypothetical protein